VAVDVDRVFKALADPSRRRLLDSLRQEDGQTLGRLCAQLAMARQSVTQHLAILEEANLISTVRNGREKLHYLNPVPIHDIQQRWLAPFDHPRLSALTAIKQNAEQPDMKPNFVYVTYIESTPERVWHALTDADLTAEYWGHSNVSDWQPGSTWEHRRTDGSGVADGIGRVLEATPPTKLVITFEEPATFPADDPSTVTFLIEPYQDIVRLTVTHANLAGENELQLISAGWPAVLANLKSKLETGHVLPQAPWEMHAS
jgi:uncharacterized protein YndB with AHSA1/START domain/DNA-binding transcriptional ArsR family regulator